MITGERFGAPVCPEDFGYPAGKAVRPILSRLRGACGQMFALACCALQRNTYFMAKNVWHIR